MTPLPQSLSREQLASKVPEALAHSLAHESPIDPNLARIVDAWPSLPEPIRRAMLALAESVR